VSPRLIPPSPNFASKAEEKVWEALRGQLPDDAFLAANVHLKLHQDTYEADLVVGLPDVGFAVIEVKGGQISRTDAGWQQATRDGLKPIDPAGQADRAKRALDTYARSRGWNHGPIRFESLVAFPDTAIGPEDPGPDAPRWSVIAAGDRAETGEIVFRALNRRISRFTAPTAAQVAQMGDLLGGRGDPQADLVGVSEARADHVRRLTEEQYDVLQLFAGNPCVQVTGGPGTGKTWLALEQARTYAGDGEHVLFVCYSRGLARWLTQAVAAMPAKIARRITVKTFGALGVSMGVEVPDGVSQAWWDATLPTLMLDRATPSYDALVVDEAQDFGDSWWPPLLALLRAHRMFVAGDEQQTVFAHRRGRPPVPMASMSLRENLRNTAQIAAVLNPLAATQMSYRGGEGPPVRFVPCPAADSHAVADREVEALLDAGHPAGDIVVLTTHHRHEFHRSYETEHGKDSHWDGYWLEDEVFYSTVMGFKGLERPCVVLAVDGFHEGVARDVMYAGLSRARDQLVVCGDPAEVRSVIGDDAFRRMAEGGLTSA
jgi:hypothetical protein